MSELHGGDNQAPDATSKKMFGHIREDYSVEKPGI